NPDTLMADAITEAGEGQEPRVGTFDWSGQGDPTEETFPLGYKPNRQHPLVYHLFGTFPRRELVVLTQDDYFEYLIGASLNSKSIPAAVRKALNASSLLFVGFRLEDWKFRVLLQSIMNRSGHSLSASAGYNHVAVQLDPQAGGIQDPDTARSYLEKMGIFRGTRIN